MMATKSDGEADWEWATGHWVLEVPEELAACEFECRKESAWKGSGIGAKGGWRGWERNSERAQDDNACFMWVGRCGWLRERAGQLGTAQSRPDVSPASAVALAGGRIRIGQRGNA